MKDRNILSSIKNDLYYKYYDMDNMFILIDFFYKIKDDKTLYSFREIKEGVVFYFTLEVTDDKLIDCMVDIADHINKIYDNSEKFDFKTVMDKSVSYIKTQLKDGESVFVDFVFFDFKNYVLEYANFGTSRAFIEFDNYNVKELKIHNDVITTKTSEYKISQLDISNFTKILFCNRNFREYYDDEILENFKHSFTKNGFIEAFQGVKVIEENISFLYITHVKKEQCVKEVFECSLDGVEKANSWFEKQLEKRKIDQNLIQKIEIVFNELFLNSYEHGNLGITSEQKERYLEEDIYFDKIVELDAKCNKTTTVRLYDTVYKDIQYLITQIEDEGDGFDSDVLFNIFKHRKMLSGRGIFLSRKNSYGIHFNKKANIVMFLQKI